VSCREQRPAPVGGRERQWRPVADTIAPLVFVGSWQATETGGEPATADRAIVATIAGTAYDALERDLDDWARGGDPPLHRSGSGWRLAAPVDAWTLLRQSLTAPDIERRLAAALDVLTEIDPVLSLPPAERFSAGARGIRRAWSGLLRRGIAVGIALLGAAGDERVGDRRTGEDHARRIVRAVLASANADGSGLLWKSLADVLPLLAEAAPDEFLDAVEVALSGSPPLLMTMFEDRSASHLGSYSPHAGLLWALETLSWAPAYLSRTTDQLARLAEADPGWRLSNRPSDFLRRVFLPCPCTAAPSARRTAVLSGLAERRPQAAFGLLLPLAVARGYKPRNPLASLSRLAARLAPRELAGIPGGDHRNHRPSPASDPPGSPSMAGPSARPAWPARQPGHPVPRCSGRGDPGHPA